MHVRCVVIAVVVGTSIVACSGARPPADEPAPRPRPCRFSRACEAGERCNRDAPDANGFGVCVPGLVTREQCASEYAAVPRSQACHWVVERLPYCGGPAPPEKLLEPACSCRACTEDAHCTDRPGGACTQAVPEDGCGAPVSVCAYPGDACHPSSPCSAPNVCVVSGQRASGESLRCGERPAIPKRP